jgi:hypothetical protein
MWWYGTSAILTAYFHERGDTDLPGYSTQARSDDSLLGELIKYLALLFSLPSLWSLRIRWRKSSTIRERPFLNATFGSHPNRSFALEMSGFLMWGSSAVFLQNSMVAAGSSTSFTTCKSHLPMSHLWAMYWAVNIPANWWSKAKQCNEWNILSRVD